MKLSNNIQLFFNIFKFDIQAEAKTCGKATTPFHNNREKNESKQCKDEILHDPFTIQILTPNILKYN